MRARTNAEFCGGGCGSAVDWQPHCIVNCSFCAGHTAKGCGRPVKAKAAPKKTHDVSTCSSTDTQASFPTVLPGTLQVATTSLTTINTDSMDITAEQVVANACEEYRAGLELNSERYVDEYNAEVGELCKNAVDIVQYKQNTMLR